MIEFMLVDYPQAFPQMCVGCSSQKGPLLDTHRDLPGFGHVYVCAECVKTGARLMGFSEGKKQDSLQNALREAAEARAAIEHHSERINELERFLAESGRREEELQDLLHTANQRVKQLEDSMLAEIKRQAAVVGAGA